MSEIPSPGSLKTAFARRIGMALAVIALWLGLRPYLGVRHDAILYTTQALRRLQPEPLGQDAAFAFGSQDSFSLFPALYAPVLGHLGVGGGHLAMAFAGQALWLLALWFFVRGLFGVGRPAVLAMAAAVALEAGYGAGFILAYGEPHVTARPWAEAAVLIALGCLVRGLCGEVSRCRLWLSGAACCLLLAAALHPLTALPGIAVAGIVVALRWPWVLLAAIGGLLAALPAVLLTTLAEVEPFVRAFRHYDAEWFAVIRAHHSYLLPGAWPLRDWWVVAARIAVLGIAFGLATTMERRLIAAVLAVGIGGVALSWIGGDIAANVLLLNLQFWRATWLLAVLANAWAAVLVIRLPPDSVGREVLLAAFVLQFLERIGSFGLLFSPVLILLGGALLLWERNRDRALPKAAKVLVRTLVLAVAGLVFLGLGIVVGHALARELMPEMRLLAAVVAIAAVMFLLSRGSSLARGRTALAVGVVLLVVAAGSNDRRTAWTRFVEDDREIAELTAFLGTDTAPYWEGGQELLWLKLRRPNAYGCYQGAGATFFRGMAITFRDRASILSALDTSDFDLFAGGTCPARQDTTRDGPTDPAEIAAVCRAMPDLEVLVLANHIPSASTGSWQAPAPATLLSASGGAPRQVSIFHRYSCADLR